MIYYKYCNAGSQFYFTTVFFFRSKSADMFLWLTNQHTAPKGNRKQQILIQVDETWSCRHETGVFRWLWLKASLAQDPVWISILSHGVVILVVQLHPIQLAPANIFKPSWAKLSHPQLRKNSALYHEVSLPRTWSPGTASPQSFLSRNRIYLCVL